MSLWWKRNNRPVYNSNSKSLNISANSNINNKNTFARHSTQCISSYRTCRRYSSKGTCVYMYVCVLVLYLYHTYMEYASSGTFYCRRASANSAISMHLYMQTMYTHCIPLNSKFKWKPSVIHSYWMSTIFIGQYSFVIVQAISLKSKEV